MRHDSLAHYLAAVGVIGLLEVASRWQGGECEFGLPLEEAAAAIEAARAARRLWPLVEPAHPLWCNRGRRSLARGVDEARTWLDRLPEDQRAAELQSLLGACPESTPVKVLKKPGGKNEGWNLGTLLPVAIDHAGAAAPAPVSAWLPVLAWEAQRLLLTQDCRVKSYERGRAPVEYAMAGVAVETDAEKYVWMTYEWQQPLTVAEVFLLLNGGAHRWHYAGHALDVVRQPYVLRDIAGGGQTAEFCRLSERRAVATLGSDPTPPADE